MMSQGIITDTPDSASDTFDAQLQPGDVIVLYVCDILFQDPLPSRGSPLR